MRSGVGRSFGVGFSLSVGHCVRGFFLGWKLMLQSAR